MESVHHINKHGDIQTPQALQIPGASHLTNSVDRHIFRRHLTRWVVGDHISFRQVESPLFRTLMTYCSSELESLLPQSCNTIRKWIRDDYQRVQLKVRAALDKSDGQIHLSFDLWTSPNSLALLGIVAFWTDENKKLQKTLLGLRQLLGQHNGENMAIELLGIVRDFGIESRIGHFMVDNAGSNDTCIQELADHLNGVFEPSKRRLRCFGHITNLVVKALLFGKDAEAFEKDTAYSMEINDDLKLLKAWRKRGPVGKIHNIVTYIRRTPQRIASFRNIQQTPEDMDSLLVVSDNATRWNSTYDMLKRALKLRTFLEIYIQRQIELDAKSTLKDDWLVADDWNQLEELMVLLEPFKTLTTSLEGDPYEGKRGSMWEVLPAMDMLLQKLEQAKERLRDQADSTFLRTAVNNAWLVMDKYYDLTDQSPAYTIALVLNPRLKWHYIEKNWSEHPEWIKNARMDVEKIWKEYNNQPLSESAATAASEEDVSMFDAYLLEFDDDVNFNSAFDEYRDYCLSARERADNLLDWWAHKSARYPRLSKMAFDYLSIPAMSAAVERAFSSSKLMIPDARNRLSVESIEAAECLRSWIDLGLY
jgi:hypothetical protein